jgi:hypothetical protein
MAQAKSASGPLPNQLWSVPQIAHEINLPARRARHLIENGKLGDAVIKVGGKYVGLRDKLREKFGRLASDPDPLLEPPPDPARPSQRGVRLVPAGTTTAA